MAHEHARQPSLGKRYFDYLLSLAGDDRPAKQRKGEDACPGNDNQESVMMHRTNTDRDLLSTQVETKGTGTKDDPISFPTWETGNVISSEHHGSLIELSDVEDGEVKMIEGCTTSQDALKPSIPHSSARMVTGESTQGRASLVRKLPSLEHQRLTSSIDSRSAHTPVDLSKYLALLYGPLSQVSKFPTEASKTQPSPSSANTSACTKSKSTVPSPQGEALDRCQSVSLEEPEVLVKLEGYDIDNRDDERFEDFLLGCAAVTSQRSRDTCSGVVSTATRTKTRRKKRAPEEQLLCVSTVQGRDQEQDEENDRVVVFEHSKPADRAGIPWTIPVKQERGGIQTVPDLTSSQETNASEVDKQPRHSEDLFYTRKVVSAKPTFPGKGQIITSQAPVGLVERIDGKEPLLLSIRKRLFFKDYHLKRARLEKSLEKYYSSIQSERSPDRCWLYTGDKLPKPPAQSLHMSTTIRHNGRLERLSLNILVIKMLLEGRLSQEHIDGLVEHSWHASHLCGNWTCLNIEHIVVEPGSINNNRNTCFKVAQPCSNHIPKCLKHLKLDKSHLRPATNPINWKGNMAQ
jgi:hypothetical protein